MPGPLKTPNELKVIAGTDRADRLPATPPPEFEKVETFPPAPESLRELSNESVKMWDALGPQLVACGLLQIVDLYALEHMCYLWGQFKNKARGKQEVTASEANALKAYWAEFGMTSAARRRLVSTAGQTAPPQNRFASHGKRRAGGTSAA